MSTRPIYPPQNNYTFTTITTYVDINTNEYAGTANILCVTGKQFYVSRERLCRFATLKHWIDDKTTSAYILYI